jgi:hypothetical protein
MPESNVTPNQAEPNNNNSGNYGNPATLDEIDKLLQGGATDGQAADKKDAQNADNSAGDDGDSGTDAGQDQDADTNNSDDDSAGDGDNAADDKTGVDYAAEIPLANGEKITIGALKDFYQGQAIRELELQERETELIGKLEESAAIAEALNVIPESIRNKVLQDRQNNLALEHGKIMTIIPDWKDRTIYEADRTAIYQMGKEYGLDGMFEKITDARAVKFLHDACKLRQRIKAAGALIKQNDKNKPKPKPGPQQNRAARQAEFLNKAKHGSPDDKINAVSVLLGG